MSAYDTYKNAIVGIPFDPNKKPSKQGAIQAFAEMQLQLEGAQSGALVKDTLVNLQALTSVSETSIMAWIVNDPSQAKNGIYENTGTAVAPSWTKRADVPQFFVTGINSGDGSENLIDIETDLPVPTQSGRCIIGFEIVSENTGNVSVAINGNSPLNVVSSDGSLLTSGQLLENMFVIGSIFGTEFRIISDLNSAANSISAASSSVSAAASAAAAGASSGRLDAGNFAELATKFVYSSPGAGQEIVSDGDLIRVVETGFIYKVRTTGSTDWNLDYTGSSGVKLDIMPILASEKGGIWPLAALGLDFTGATDESSKIQKLFNTASLKGGGQLFHPGGTILCSGIDGKAGVGLLGVGPTSLFKRNNTASSDQIEWQDAEAVNVWITNCAFDIATIDNPVSGANVGGTGDYATCVRMDDFRTDGSELLPNNVHVTGCHFFNSNKANSGNWTLSALQFRGINGFTVTGNSADGIQFKLGGSAANTIGGVISGNRFKESQAYCISVVVRGGGDIQLREVLIEGNTFDDFYRGAVFVGYDDGSGGDLVMENVVIRNNIFRVGAFIADKGYGGTRSSSTFIVYRMPNGGGLGGFVVEDNTFLVSTGVDGGAAAIFTGGGAGNDRLIVRNNTFETHGTMERILSHGSNVHLIDNLCLGNTQRAFNDFNTTSVCVGNKFYGFGVGGHRINFNPDCNEINIRDNEWINCPMPLGFKTGLIVYRPANGVNLTGLVRGNVVSNPDGVTVTEAFVSEQGNNDVGANVWNVQFENNHIGAGIKLFDARETPLSNLRGNWIADEALQRVPAQLVNGGIGQRPVSADPSNPATGESVMWVSDGTGSGDAGDVMVKINVGGTTKTVTLIDYSGV